MVARAETEPEPKTEVKKGKESYSETGERFRSIYLLNTSIIPNLPWDSGLIMAERASLADVRELLLQGYTSAVGHPGTAQFLSQLLKMPIELARREITIYVGDILVCFKLKTRLPEGVILTEDEMQKYQWEFLIFHF